MALLFATAIAALPGNASGQESPGRFEMTPYGAYRFGGTFTDGDSGFDAELEDSASAGLILNLRESANTQWELIYARQTTEADVSDFTFPDPVLDVDIDSLQLGGTYLGEVGRYRPYMAATIGGSRISPTLSDVDGDTFWSFSIGGGVQLFPRERFGVRLEARLWGTLVDSDSDLFCASGPQGGLCAIALEGDVLWQFETFAGLVFRF